MDESYNSCIFAKRGDCGPYPARKETCMSELSKLKNDVSTSIKALNVRLTSSVLSGNCVLQQCGLIAHRAYIQQSDVSENAKICPRHRYLLGKDYKPGRGCKHEDHVSGLRGKKKEFVRPASLALVEISQKRSRIPIVIGDCFCTVCRNKLEKNKNDESDSELADPSCSVTPGATVATLPEVNESIQRLCEYVSPVKYQLRTPVAEMSSSTKRKMKRKLEKCINAATDLFCEAMAPGQGLELKKALLDVPSPTNINREIPFELKYLVEAFENAPSFQVKLIILTLVPESFSKKDVCEYFGVTKYVIEKARKIRSDFGAGATPPVKTIYRQRLSLPKAEHFLDFLFETGLFQDVAYGTTSLKLSDGQKILIPHIIRSTLKMNIVRVYINHCESLGYDSLSTSSLLRILDHCKTSERRQMSGTDNYTADGLEGFKLLDKLIDSVHASPKRKEHLRNLKKASLLYLKGDFRSHVVKLQSN